MSELRELYQEVILDHSKRPRNFRAPESFTQKADGHNPLCGDVVTVYLKVKGGVIEDVAIQGSGCAISTASASMMSEALARKTPADAEALFDAFHRLLTDEPGTEGRADLGKLEVFSGVREFPIRVKCATLAWHTMRAALARSEATVTTE